MLRPPMPVGPHSWITAGLPGPSTPYPTTSGELGLAGSGDRRPAALAHLAAEAVPRSSIDPAATTVADSLVDATLPVSRALGGRRVHLSGVDSDLERTLQLLAVADLFDRPAG
jgi:hypothetical protein